MAKYASEVVKLMQSWVGIKEGSKDHKMILDIYNSQKPLPRGYAMTMSDPWCAATTTAAAVKLGYTDIIPCECSCNKLIEIAKAKGIWVEDESVVPEPGWLCIYDWDDNGKGDCKGSPEHVGMVEKASGGRFTVIEGNYSNSVKIRTLEVNGKYLRGFIAPKYDTEKTTPEKSVDDLAREVIDGKHGNGAARKASLGDMYEVVQQRVNEILLGKASAPVKTVDELAREVIAGKHGNGEARRKSLGDRYEEVQNRVNELLR